MSVLKRLLTSIVIVTDEKLLLGDVPVSGLNSLIESTGQKDNSWRAIIAVNVCALTVTLFAACFKDASHNGFRVIEFQLIRNFSAFLLSVTWCLCAGYNPIKQFPSKMKYQLMWRSITG